MDSFLLVLGNISVPYLQQVEQMYESPGQTSSVAGVSGSGSAQVFMDGGASNTAKDKLGSKQSGPTVSWPVPPRTVDAPHGTYADQYAAVQIDPKRIVIDSILVALVGSASEATKLNMLVFLQQEGLPFFHDIGSDASSWNLRGGTHGIPEGGPWGLGPM